MEYYRVPKHLDQTRLYKENKTNHHKTPNGYFLIANELLTEKECKKLNAPIHKLKKVNISKNNIYWFFGARFENHNNLQPTM